MGGAAAGNSQRARHRNLHFGEQNRQYFAALAVFAHEKRFTARRGAFFCIVWARALARMLRSQKAGVVSTVCAYALSAHDWRCSIQTRVCGRVLGEWARFVAPCAHYRVRVQCVCVCAALIGSHQLLIRNALRHGHAHCSGFDKTPSGMAWDDRNFPLYLALFLQAACNVTCTAPIPQIMTLAWQLDTASVADAVSWFQQQRKLFTAPIGNTDRVQGNLYASLAPGGGAGRVAVNRRGDSRNTVNERDVFGMTAAHLAIIRGDVLTFRALLQDQVCNRVSWFHFRTHALGNCLVRMHCTCTACSSKFDCIALACSLPIICGFRHSTSQLWTCTLLEEVETPATNVNGTST